MTEQFKNTHSIETEEIPTADSKTEEEEDIVDDVSVHEEERDIVEGVSVHKSSSSVCNPSHISVNNQVLATEYPIIATEGTFMDGISVIQKESLKAGDVVGVFTPAEEKDQLFWLLKVISTSARKVDGLWLDKWKSEDNIYELLNMTDKVSFISVVSPSKSKKNIYQIHLNSLGSSTYRISPVAVNHLNIMCKMEL